MPNLASLYNKITSVKKEAVVNGDKFVNKDIDQGRAELLSNWRNSTITVELRAELENEIVTLFDECINLAVSNNNSNKIQTNLIRISTLKETLQKYV